ncbi:MAG TPA: phosphatase PAP2 family protein [Candidatus Sulfotelmatobacter sp.]|nr:phosphatase PAP2 family protein [Candidatus Sulfotelmatobacter sp.]
MGPWLTGLQRADQTVFLLLNGLTNPLFDAVMPVLSRKGWAIALATALLVGVMMKGSRRAWLLVAIAVAALVLADQGANLLKAVVHRARPCHLLLNVHLLAGCTGSFAFPSNHATNMFAMAGVGWFGPRWLRWSLIPLAAAVAYSRVYLGVHYPGDVLGGAVLGAALGWSLARLALGWLLPADRPRPAPSPLQP